MGEMENRYGFAFHRIYALPIFLVSFFGLTLYSFYFIVENVPQYEIKHKMPTVTVDGKHLYNMCAYDVNV